MNYKIEHAYYTPLEKPPEFQEEIFDEDGLKIYETQDEYNHRLEEGEKGYDAWEQSLHEVASTLCRLGLLAAIVDGWDGGLQLFVCCIYQEETPEFLEELFFEPKGFRSEDVRNADLCCAMLYDLMWNYAAEYFRPKTSESIDDYCNRKCLSFEDFVSIREQIKLAKGNINILKKLGAPKNRPEAQEMVIPLVYRLIPKGLIVLLAGDNKLGKTTAALELGNAVANANDYVWGLSVNKAACDGVVLFASAEDNAGTFNEVLKKIDPEGRACKLVGLFSDNEALDTILSDFLDCGVSLLIVDPAKSFCEGNEDSSEHVSEFFKILRNFSNKTGCAVVVVHHLKKNAKVRGLSDVFVNIRGSKVFTDRPRVILGMYRNKKGQTVIGIPKVDGVPKHNLPPSCNMIEHELVFVRDAETMSLVPVGDVAACDGVENEPAVNVIDLVYSAIQQLNVSVQPVFRTGGKGLYEQGVQELKNIARQDVRDAIDALIQSNRIMNTPKGLLVV